MIKLSKDRFSLLMEKNYIQVFRQKQPSFALGW